MYLGHESTLTLSGDNTAFDDEIDLSLENAVVHETTVASRTAIVARVTPDASGPTGFVDVTIDGPDGELVLIDAIEVLPSLELQRTQGTVATLSEFVVDVVAPDVRFPFDPDALVLEAEGSSGIHYDLVSATPYAARFRVFADADATAGSGSLVVTSGDGTAAVTYRAPGALDLEPRGPTALDVAAMPTAVDGPAPFESHLYSIGSPTEPIEVKLDLILTSPGVDAKLIVLSPSGSWEEVVGFGSSVSFVAFGDPVVVLVADAGSSEPYSYDLVSTVTPAPNVESESNDTCGQCDIVETFPTTLLGTLDGDGAQDWYRIDVGAADSGKSLRARTTAGEIDTDTELTLFSADCTSTLAGPSDIDYHENLVSPPLAQGIYFVRVQPSQVFPSEGEAYKITFTMQ